MVVNNIINSTIFILTLLIVNHHIFIIFETNIILLIILLKYKPYIINIWTIYMVVNNNVWIWTLISKETLHYPCHPNTTLFCGKDVKFWIYLNCTRLFYKSNFNHFFPCMLFKWNKWKFILGSFSKLYTYMIKTYKIPTHLKENTFEFFLITIQKIFFCEKIWFDKLEHLFMQKGCGERK